MASRLLWDKGVCEFVQMTRILRQNGVKARFLVAGAPDGGNPSNIDEETIERWKREGSVEFLGHRDDMPALLSEVNIAVLPSYHEGVPKFLLEAAATGLPLVATDIEGCRVIVREGFNGLLVPPRDVSALADAVQHLLQDEELRERFGKASRRIAVEKFSEGIVNRQYLDLYRRLEILK
jgi:glycosyltransferase involved in cell wall biosynthesis